MNKLKIRIIAPDRVLYEGGADSLSYPIDGGVRGVLPGHTRLIAVIPAGEIRVKNDKKEERFPIKKGLIKINRYDLSLLVS